MVKELYLIRHGQTEENKANIIQGQLDGRLTPEGRAQLLQLGQRFKEIPLELIICSEMGRALGSAYSFNAGYGNTLPIEICGCINERHWGILQGKKVMETGLAKLIKQEDLSKQVSGNEIYSIDPQNPLFSSLEGVSTMESLRDFVERGRKFCYDYLPNVRENNIAVIGHDWMHSNLVNIFMGLKPQLHVLNNGHFHYLKVDYSGKEPQVLEYYLNLADPQKPKK